MRLTRVYVRFYKSFNFDYERKAHRGATQEPWELMDDGTWYPFVRIDIEPDVTTIVGANESGKSHLLDAIRKLITGSEISWESFCRYSAFFSAEQGRVRVPDFGGEFEVLTAEGQEILRTQLELSVPVGGRFHLFRENGSAVTVYWNAQRRELTPAQVAALEQGLPEVFTIDAQIPLPDAVSLHQLTETVPQMWGSRRSRWEFISGVARDWGSEQELQQQVPEIFKSLSAARRGTPEDPRATQQQILARALLFDVAHVDPLAIKTLREAIADQHEGFVNGIIDEINDALARHLNFPRWWAQDRDFRLMVSPREQELAFTIRDRTGTDYSFTERSHGLKYFLSYFVQLKAHVRKPGKVEILLMDEPDAFLSSQGQQDLLRILEDFAHPEDGSRQDQVVYVTHSPFLVNRNVAPRIRVLDKGVGDEGTRVVRDAAQNHYEPLRSALGPFVAETAFIGGSNLFVEGLADQVLLAGMSSHLRSVGVPSMDRLDLNEVTIVPAGSASSVPYMIYLARGRDELHPPCVALLDGDKAGRDAVKAIARGGAHGRQLLAPEFVIQLSDWASALSEDPLVVSSGVVIRELEDLIPLEIAVAAARKYAERVLGLPVSVRNTLTEDTIAGRLTESEGCLWDAAEAAFAASLGDGAHIEKVGFAKEVVAVTTPVQRVGPSASVKTLEANFGRLLADIARRLRKAKQLEESARLNNRLVRALDRFLDDHPQAATRQDGRLLIETVEDAIEDTVSGDRIRAEVAALRREFKLAEDLTKPIERFDEFKTRVKNLRYSDRFAHQAIALPAIGSVATASPNGESHSPEELIVSDARPTAHADASRPAPDATSGSH